MKILETNQENGTIKMTEKHDDNDSSPKGEELVEGQKKRPSLEEIRKSRNTFGGNGSFGGSKIGGGSSRGKGGAQSRPTGSARGR